MKTALTTLLLLVVAFAVAMPVAAENDRKKKDRPAVKKEAKKEGKKDGKKKRAPKGLAGQAAKMTAAVELSAEQKEKLEALVAKHSEAIKAANDAAALTAEQKKARAAAAGKARADGKKGKEIQEAVAAALDLSAEQKEALMKVAELNKAFRDGVNDILTDEQRKEIAAARKGKGKKKAE